LQGKAIVITHSASVIDHRIIADSSESEQSITINGEMSAAPTTATVYTIYNNFWVLEFAIYLPTLTAITDVIGVPQDFEEVYRLGLFWQYYAQEGENKVEIDRYQKLFDDEKMRFCSDQNRFRSDNNFMQPRTIPNIFTTRNE